MESALNPQIVFDTVDRIKKQGNAWKTNCFLTEQQIRELSVSNALSAIIGDQWLALVKTELQFERLYLTAASLDSLDRALKQADLSRHEFLVADLVGREEEARQMAAIFRDNGFRDYALYQRMVRIPAPGKIMPESFTDAAGFASVQDAEDIYKIICADFDPVCDHLPSLKEVEDAVSTRAILIGRGDSGLLGFYFFETAGFTSLGRYVWVNEHCRGQGIGSSLTRRYFHENPHVRRFILWVNAGNIAATATYRRCGYREDRLVDYIMVRGG